MVSDTGRAILVSTLLALPLTAGAQDAQLDIGFGDGGMVTTANQGQSFHTDLLHQLDGKILVTGNSGEHPAVIRYLDNGSIDTTFGKNGIATIAGASTSVLSIALQSDQKILILGNNHLTRVDSSGNRDESFGIDGSIEVEALHLAIQPDDKILLHSSSSISRFDANAKAFDPTFGNAGVAAVTRIHSIALQSTGKIVVGTNSPPQIIRLNSDGTIDGGFATDSAAHLAPSQPESVTALFNGLQTAKDGTIMVTWAESFAIGPFDGLSEVHNVRLQTDGTVGEPFIKSMNWGADVGPRASAMVGGNFTNDAHGLTVQVTASHSALLTFPFDPNGHSSVTVIGPGYTVPLLNFGALDPPFIGSVKKQIPGDSRRTRIAIDHVGRVLVLGSFTETEFNQFDPTQGIRSDTLSFLARISPASALSDCAGDCDGDQVVGIAEVIQGINIALGQRGISTCATFDANEDGLVSIGEILGAIRRLLNGC